MTQTSPFYFQCATRLLAAAFAVLSFSSASQAQTSIREIGVWLDDSGSGAVEVYICNDRADRLCGRIVWLKEPLNAEGVPKRDKYNPNASMQNRPICGLPVLGNLAQLEEGGFDGGWIYDPKVGKSYNAAIQAAEGGRLVVTGYLGMKMLGKTFYWTRAPADIARCNGAPQAKGAAAPAAGGAAKKAAATAPAKKPAATPAAADGSGANAKTKPAASATGTGTQKSSGAVKKATQPGASPAKSSVN